MFSLTFGLGSRKPKYFPETEMNIQLSEDDVSCNLSGAEMNVLIGQDEFSTKIVQDDIIIKFDEGI